MSTRCLAGNLRHSVRTASTTTILNSSAMSLMKAPICGQRGGGQADVPQDLLGSVGLGMSLYSMACGGQSCRHAPWAVQLA